jgi:hypothetical protein
VTLREAILENVSACLAQPVEHRPGVHEIALMSADFALDAAEQLLRVRREDSITGVMRADRNSALERISELRSELKASQP